MRYTLPAITADGQDTSVGVEITNDAKLREWLRDVKRFIAVDNFRFNWSRDPHAVMPYLLGEFCVLWYLDGIHIKLKLCHEDYRDVEYPVGDLWRMLFEHTRPSLGWCVNVTV